MIRASASKPRLLQPGLRLLPPGTERYRVRGGGAMVLAMGAGDSLEIIDPEGRQPGELTVFGPAGENDSGLLGVRSTGPSSAMAEILSSDAEDARAIASTLARRGIGTDAAEALHMFGPETPAGESVTFTAEQESICILAAPGGPMRVDEQNPPTDLVAFVRRASIADAASPPLPEPLADQRLDIRIDRCTAQAYQVKAGEFIQIIDVEGRECSDFQVFTVAGLDAGVERCLDATATRTLMGAAFPGPGLYAKYFDLELQPLVELVRDTVGRHDTFNFACNAKYYDDMGYPGHVNCTDNFNGALEPYGVKPRLGWQTMNFFYNTNLDDNNQIFLDEPWSRPGDYVLVKALTDSLLQEVSRTPERRNTHPLSGVFANKISEQPELPIPPATLAPG